MYDQEILYDLLKKTFEVEPEHCFPDAQKNG